MTPPCGVPAVRGATLPSSICTGYLMVDPRIGARAVIRDTGSDAGRYLWSVLGAGEMEPMAQGRTSDLEQARSIAEAALRAYGESGVGGTGR